MNRRLTFSGFLWNFDFFMAGLCILTLVIITALGVFMRYALNSPLTWLEEIQFILAVQGSFWGASVAFKNGGHIAIEIVVDTFPPKIRQIAEIGIGIIVFIALFFIMQQQITRTLSLYSTGRKTQILNFPVFLNYATVSLACLFMIVHFAIHNFKKNILKKNPK